MEEDVDEYGICRKCGHRAKVACTCGMTFAEKIRTVGVDEEALRKFHADDARGKSGY